MPPEVIIDRAKRTATYRGATQRLPPVLFETLACLCDRPGVIKSRPQIMNTAMEAGGMWAKSDRCVDTAIRRLRRLGFDGLRSYYGGGYYWDD